MNVVRSYEYGLTAGGAFVADIRQLGQRCNTINFSFVKREDNSVAHALAKFITPIYDYIVWLKNSLSWVEDFLV